MAPRAPIDASPGPSSPTRRALRARFLDRQPLASSPPLVFGPPPVPEGFHDRRTTVMRHEGLIPVTIERFS